MSKVVTVTGDVERVTFENENTGFRVLQLGRVQGELGRRARLTVVGTAPAVGPGTRVRASGQLVDDARHGEQLRADSIVLLLPETREGVERYLASGVLPGVGEVIAKRIVDTFGTETLTVLDSQPERLTQVPGISAKRVGAIKQHWSEHRAESTTLVLLQSFGMSPQLARRVLRTYGERTATIVQQSPYRLALDVWGVGFKTADKIAEAAGIGREHPERLEAGTLHELSRVSEQGHVFITREELVTQTAEMLAVDQRLVDGAIDRLWAAERVVIEDGAVALARLFEAERKLAALINDYLSTEVAAVSGVDKAVQRFETETSIELSDQQKAAVTAAATNRVVIITGGPGVGKTTLVRAIVAVFAAAQQSLHLAAPTGRAAKRLSESTRHDAWTIHRLLEFDPRHVAFKRNADCPLDDGIVLIDEASMLDLLLALAVAEALPKSGRLILVGDVDQLPSVGPGAILRDLVTSRSIPVVRLDTIFRQSNQSLIVKNAHRLLQGSLPESGNAADQKSDFFWIERRDADQAASDLVHLVTKRIPERFGFDPRREIQVLTPMHRGAAGTVELNRRLQESFNPDAEGIQLGAATVRVGDKIMQTRNDYEREVFNGDTGWVVDLNAQLRELVVDYDGRLVRYGSEDLDALVLAYAISIHKSQGSEYPVVVVPILTTHFVMLTRNLVYTAITRARRLCVLVADPRALRIALGEDRREARFTRLAQRLVEAGTLAAAPSS
ncbi:MAG TPA: ATP-dependent RecD-like DNA helicase [Polyangiaceae bacterium]|nr:ATP-dependent RecD-like DNA helicase [Polyangiaceae bacterium]